MEPGLLRRPRCRSVAGPQPRAQAITMGWCCPTTHHPDRPPAPRSSTPPASSRHRSRPPRDRPRTRQATERRAGGRGQQRGGHQRGPDPQRSRRDPRTPARRRSPAEPGAGGGTRHQTTGGRGAARPGPPGAKAGTSAPGGGGNRRATHAAATHGPQRGGRPANTPAPWAGGLAKRGRACPDRPHTTNCWGAPPPCGAGGPSVRGRGGAAPLAAGPQRGPAAPGAREQRAGRGQTTGSDDRERGSIGRWRRGRSVVEDGWMVELGPESRHRQAVGGCCAAAAGPLWICDAVTGAERVAFAPPGAAAPSGHQPGRKAWSRLGHCDPGRAARRPGRRRIAGSGAPRTPCAWCGG